MIKIISNYSIWVLATLAIGWLSTLGLFQLGSGALTLSRDYGSKWQLANVAQLKSVEPKEIDFASLAPYVAAVTNYSISSGSSSETINLTFVGDIMLDRGVEQSVNKYSAGDYSFLFNNLDWLKNSDIVFANLEGSLSDKGEDLGGQYSFRMKPIALSALDQFGFNVLSVANNHAGDWGQEAFVDTLTRLSDFSILHPGGGLDQSEAEKPAEMIINDTRFGFLGFSDVGPAWLAASDQVPGILLASDPKLVDIIRQASKTVDILIVSFHFGNEYEEKANSRQRQLAQLAIDSGAKIVVGHHPHVVQEIEEYKNGLIAYSLGNFIFDQYFSEETMAGLVLQVEVSGKDISSWQTKKIKINDRFQPSLVE